MKFLVTTTEGPGFSSGQEMVDVLESVVLPGFDEFLELEKTGTIVGGLPLGGRSLVFIVEASSNDEVDKMLRTLPMWSALESEVTALQSFQGRANIEKEVVAQLNAGD